MAPLPALTCARVAFCHRLQGEKKERFNEIQQELSQLSTKFSNNVSRAGRRSCCHETVEAPGSCSVHLASCVPVLDSEALGSAAQHGCHGHSTPARSLLHARSPRRRAS